MNSRSFIKPVWIMGISLAGIYLVINLGLPRVGYGIWTLYLAQPLIWLILFLFTVRVLPPYRHISSRVRSHLLLLAITGGIAQVVALALGGVFSGYGASPYTFTPLALARTFFLVASTLVGMEFSRAWLIKRWDKKHPAAALAGVAMFFTLLAVPLSVVIGLKLDTGSINYLVKTFLPLLAESLLATQLARNGGPLISLTYRGILQAFWWFSPVLPALGWTFQGLIGIGIPLFIMVATSSLQSRLVRRVRPRRRDRVSGQATAGWLFTSILGVCIIWFAVGLFPLKPVLIASGSMRPYMEVGDIAITVTVAPNNIRVSDIIQFRKSADENVIHRVIEIRETEKSRVFITKGDANEDPDIDPVISGAIIGKNVFVVPKLGWLSVLVKGFMGN